MSTFRFVWTELDGELDGNWTVMDSVISTFVGILDFKAQKNKKIFSDLLQNFSNFFLKFRVFCKKPSHTKGYTGLKPVQFPVQFRLILQKHVQIVIFHQKLHKMRNKYK